MSARFALLALCCSCGRLAFDALEARDARPSTDAVDAPRFQIDAGECPPGYMFAGTSCYRPVVNPGVEPVWLVAEQLCEADEVGAHLAVIDTAAEAQTVGSVVGSSIMDHWIGASGIVTSGVFLTVTNLPIPYAKWAAGEPDGSGDCLSLSTADAALHDRPCFDVDDYVCEYDGIAAVPAAYGQ